MEENSEKSTTTETKNNSNDVEQDLSTSPKEDEKSEQSEKSVDGKENETEEKHKEAEAEEKHKEAEVEEKPEKGEFEAENGMSTGEGADTMEVMMESPPSPTFGRPTSSSTSITKEVTKLQEKLNVFLKWCEQNSLTLSEKVTVEFQGTSHRYGMLAKQDIKRGETLFKIPRKLLLDPQQGRLSSQLTDYENWLEHLGRSLDDSSGWVPLLITLMFEYIKPESFWTPYLNLIPEISEFGHPLFWKQEVGNRELSGMALLHDLSEDRKNIEEEYKAFVLPFIMRNRDLAENIEKYDMNLFKRMIAFVMAYSFTEDQESPSMIPMADMLNHHSNNNAHLIFERNCLKMVSCRKIDKGEEIYNTFGKLGNAELLQMYGYTEGKNNYDTFTVYVKSFIEVVEKSKRIPSSYVQAMSTLLHKSEIAMSYDFFVFDRNGMRRGPDLIQFLKILHMTEEEFEVVLKTRAGTRPDSFYQKLLRKLKLAKKTDTSSGVAVIDITEDENDSESPNKRSFECEEIEDNDGSGVPVKRQCLYEGGADAPLSHFDDSDAAGTAKLSHYPITSAVNGLDHQQPIVIDDESESENEPDSENKENKEESNENIVKENNSEIDTKEKDQSEKKTGEQSPNVNNVEQIEEKTDVEIEKGGENESPAEKESPQDIDKEVEKEPEKIDIDNNKTEPVLSDVLDDNKGEEFNSGDEESDGDDDIEIISEDVGCAITFEKLKDQLQPEWKETIRTVLESQLSAMKSDEGIVLSEAKETLSRDQCNAYNVRQGQRNLMQTFLRWLS